LLGGESLLPNRIDAFLTRDWPYVYPGKIPGFQAGLLVIRPSVAHFESYLEVIREGNFSEGYGNTAGWGGKGYGGFVGAKAIQGIVAYFYDILRPNTMVELNGCLYNWMNADVHYNSQPSYSGWRKKQLSGTCRNGRENCEDCFKTPLSLVKTIHYTNCRKPWTCPGDKGMKGAVDHLNTNAITCEFVHRAWNEERIDFEDKLHAIAGDEGITRDRSGAFKQDWFLGHCREAKPSGYIGMVRNKQLSFSFISAPLSLALAHTHDNFLKFSSFASSSLLVAGNE
jgi:hypothetical protein